MAQQTAGERGQGSHSAEQQAQKTSSQKHNISAVPTSTVYRVNNLANLEALLNIIANGCEILGLAVGGPACLLVPFGLFFIFKKQQRFIGALMIFTGPAVCILALAAPGIINWIVGCMHDANLFS